MKGTLPTITLVQLTNFHKLAQTRHFTEAARQLYITQPTLSASIKALENELGVSLVYREGRRNVRLTQAGEEFDASIAPLLEQLFKVIERTSSRGDDNKHPLLIGTIPTVQYDYLPRVLRDYWDACGYDKSVRITVEFTNALIRGLKDQTYEVIICSRVPEETDIEFIPVLTKPLVAVVAKSGPYGSMDSLDLCRLETIPFATYRESAPIGREVRSLLDSTGLELNPAASFDDEFSLSGFVAASGDVVGLMLDTYEIRPFLKDVNVVPIDGVGADWHPICLAYDKRLSMGSELRIFKGLALRASCL